MLYLLLLFGTLFAPLALFELVHVPWLIWKRGKLKKCRAKTGSDGINNDSQKLGMVITGR